MATVENFLNKAKEVAHSARDKTGELVDKTKLRMEISSLEKQLSDAYESIGRLVYAAQKSGEDTAQALNEAIEQAAAINDQLEQMQNRQAEMAHAVRCAHCGAYNESDSLFCKKCGEKL